MAFTRSKATQLYKDGQQPTGNTFAELFASIPFLNSPEDLATLFGYMTNATVLDPEASLMMAQADGSPRLVKMSYIIDMAGSSNLGTINNENFDPGAPTKSVNYVVKPSKTQDRIFANLKDENGDPIEVAKNVNGTVYYIASGDYWDYVENVLPDNVLEQSSIGVSIARQRDMDSIYPFSPYNTAAAYATKGVAYIDDASKFVESSNFILLSIPNISKDETIELPNIGAANLNAVILNENGAESQSFNVLSLKATTAGKLYVNLYFSTSEAVDNLDLNNYYIGRDRQFVPKSELNSFNDQLSNISDDVKNATIATNNNTDRLAIMKGLSSSAKLSDVSKIGYAYGTPLNPEIVVTDGVNKYFLIILHNVFQGESLWFNNLGDTIITNKIVDSNGIEHDQINTVVNGGFRVLASASGTFYFGWYSNDESKYTNLNKNIQVKRGGLSSTQTDVCELSQSNNLLMSYAKGKKLSKYTDYTNFQPGPLLEDGNIDTSQLDYFQHTDYITSDNISYLTVVECNLPFLNNAWRTCFLFDVDGIIVGRYLLQGKHTLVIPFGYKLILSIQKNTDNYVRVGSTQNLQDETQTSGGPWESADIWWCGTSIPAQGYPQLVASKLSANVYNESQGSSMIRKGTSVGDIYNELSNEYWGLYDVAFDSLMYSLGTSQVEKAYIMQNWTTERRKNNLQNKGYTSDQVAQVKGFSEIIQGAFYGGATDPTDVGWPSAKPQDIMADQWSAYRKAVLAMSYDSYTDALPGVGLIEGKVDKYLNSNYNIDVWAFDHGHNDYKVTESVEQFAKIPLEDDNCYFLGAINKIIRRILAYNPKAKIIFISHYTDKAGAGSEPVRIRKAHEVISQYWQAPLCDLYNRLRMSQALVETSGYWQDQYTWSNSGYNGSNDTSTTQQSSNDKTGYQLPNGLWVRKLTQKQIWMWDDLHPASSDAKDYISDTIVGWFNTIR